MSGFVPTLKVDEAPVVQNSKPNIKKPIPPIPAGLDLRGKITLALFYQYVEPAWTSKQHKHAIKRICEIARKCGVNGRGRCAPEGLNCTLTATAAGMRAFCQGLRDFDPVFENTDFKFTDDVAYEHRFKALSIKKVGELVAYGLEGDIAPSLRNGGQHLEATDYHKMLVDTKGPPTVVIDVRNAYESAIGHFQPPPGGAELLDPKMRNSNGFPYWLALPETREKLNGKRVMMYCTGGIRCERATALLNEITATDPTFKTQGVYECRGGIERYLKTFPKGGVWKGKNYVFDRRQVQVPAEKPEEDLKKEVESKCANPACRRPWDDYIGRLKCCGEVPLGATAPGSTRCAVPVMLCDRCFEDPAVDNSKQRCDLCQEGYVPPLARVKIDLQGQKRKVLIMGGKVLDKSHLKQLQQEQPKTQKRARGDTAEVAAATDTATAGTASVAAATAAAVVGGVAKKQKKKKDKKKKKPSKEPAAARPLLFCAGGEEDALDSDSDSSAKSDSDSDVDSPTAGTARGGGLASSDGSTSSGGGAQVASAAAPAAPAAPAPAAPVDGRRLFVKQLPFIVTAAEVREAVGTAAGGGAVDVELVDWKRDAVSGLFYGAAFVLMASPDAAARVVAASRIDPGIVVGDAAAIAIAAAAVAAAAGNGSGKNKKNKKKKKGKGGGKSKRLKVALAPLRDGEVWPPPGFTEEASPPVV